MVHPLSRPACITRRDADLAIAWMRTCRSASARASASASRLLSRACIWPICARSSAASAVAAAKLRSFTSRSFRASPSRKAMYSFSSGTVASARSRSHSRRISRSRSQL